MDKQSDQEIDENKKKETIPFWLENPNILLHKDHAFEFYPSVDMTLNQKLNAITRTILAFCILGLFITNNKIRFLFISLLCILMIVSVHEFFKKKESFINKLNPAMDYLEENKLLNKELPIFQEPSSTNPYGNVLVSDYELNPQKLPAPPMTNPIVNDMVTANAIRVIEESNPGQPEIAEKLFRDIHEQLNFEQMNRQFISNPSTTIPNDQGAFAEFCYGSMLSCKEGNLFACARNTSHYTNY